MIHTDTPSATTRALTRVRPSVTSRIPGLQETLFLPPNRDRMGEGGLRHHGYFKEPRPGKPLITVVTVVRNQARDIATTIESVLRQTYDYVEYIVIDGGSTDGTMDVIRRYDGAIDYWVSEPDNGISDAFNKGLRVATGEWINFMNAGDIFASAGVLSCVAGCVDTDADILYGKANLLDRSGQVLCALGRVFDPARFRWTMTFRHQAVFHNMEYFREYGSFDMGMKISMDYELLRRKPQLSARFCDCVITQAVIAGVSERRDFLRCRECRDIGLKHASGPQVLLVHLDYLYAMFRCCVRRMLQRLGLHCCVNWYRARRCRSL